MPAAYRPGEIDGELVDWSVGTFLRKMAAEIPDHVALKGVRDPLSGVQKSWTYSSLLNDAERVAATLLTHFKPGDHVALWCSNRPEWALVQFGMALSGLVLVAVNPASRAHELEHALLQSDAVGIVLAETFRDTNAVALLEGVRPRLPLLRQAFLIDDLTNAAPGGDLPVFPVVDPASAAMIQFTSGTTGRAKAAMLSHRGLVNIAQFTATRFALPMGSVWLNWLPMFHTGGSVFALMGCMWNHGTLVLINGFDPVEVMRTIAEERPAWMPLVPTTAIALLDHPDRPNYDLSSLAVLTQGGTPVAAELIDRLERELNVDHVVVFGQTETSSTICLGVRGDDRYHKTETVGKPMPHTEIRIVDPISNAMVEFGEVGEIQVRSCAVTMGYYGQPDETAKAIDPEGWLHTGDLGTIEPDGYLKITGRLKDVIIRGGENIYPREIEDLLVQHPGIAEAAVFGIPHERWGETPIVALRCRAGYEIDHGAICEFLEPMLARYKIPQGVWHVDAMPVTLSGKIQKFMLRDQYLAASR
ncbi:class I adenylate-forming enzyme family protein [Rhizorhabdus argentea]|uniref:class I adenylate-forming enzyme family protein n=1 Tax=Rhizorhabdus argentea TaxID=1387174 RepID=UPI0030EBD68B